MVVAGVASILIKLIKDWRIKATTETEEFNKNYGNLDPGEYYEEEKKSEVVHSHDYYWERTISYLWIKVTELLIALYVSYVIEFMSSLKVLMRIYCGEREILY